MWKVPKCPPAPVVALALAAMTLVACGQSVEDPMEDADHIVRGIARFEARVQLGVDTRMHSELIDRSQEDQVVASQELSPPGNAPVPFELRYGPDATPEDAELAVRIEVFEQDTLLFGTESPHPVERKRAVDIVEITLEPTDAGQALIDALPDPAELRDERGLDPEPYEVDLPPEVEEGLVGEGAPD